MLKRGGRRDFRGFQVPATEVRTLLPLVKIGAFSQLLLPA